jgi:hypothetical protein
VADVLAAERYDEVFFPLAAGTHIDHRIAFAVAQRLPIPVRYYEDRPYILWPGMLQARMNQIGCLAPSLAPVSPAAMAADLERYHYLSHFVPPGAFRDACLPRYYADLAAPEHYRWRGECRSREASPDEIERLYDALACYTSQMPFIYPSRDIFLRDSYAHEHTRSGQSAYVERDWSLLPL